MRTRTMKMRRLAVLSAMVVAAASVVFAAPASAADQNMQLSMEFAPTPIEPGQTSTLKLTVTNPNDTPFPNNTSFNVWDASVQLQVPALDFDRPFTDDCGGLVSGNWIFPGPSSQRILFRGSQLAGHASCTLSITLTADTAGTYTVSPSDFTVLNGADAPAGDATLVVAETLPVALVDANIAGSLGLLALLGAGGVVFLRRKHLAGS